MKALVVGLLAAALTGCAAVRPAEAPRVMRAAPAFAQAAVLSPGTYAIAPVQADGMAAERRYAYVDLAAPGEVRQAASLFWDEPPPRIVERALVSGLRARFSAVTGPEASSPAGQRVIARLERFEERTAGGGDASARIGIEVTVLRAGDRAVTLSGRYCATAPITGAEPSARAAAFEAALESLVGALADDLASGRARSDRC